VIRFTPRQTHGRMACPMRVVLAALSAFIALFILWRRNDDVADAVDVTAAPHAGKARREAKQLLARDSTQSWSSILISFFTGRFLWDVWTGKAGGGIKAD